MSRYSHTVERDGKKFEVAYGFDRPLSDYFIHVYNEEGEPIFAVASQNTLTPHPDHPTKLTWSNSELFELFQEWEVPERFKTALALDEPF